MPSAMESLTVKRDMDRISSHILNTAKVDPLEYRLEGGVVLLGQECCKTMEEGSSHSLVFVPCIVVMR